jgi:hypothetical protein
MMRKRMALRVRRNQIVRTVLYIVAGAMLSAFLAGLAEGFAYQHGLWNLTPGLILGRKVFPPDQTLSNFGESWTFELSIDSLTVFGILCVARIALVKWRKT